MILYVPTSQHHMAVDDQVDRPVGVGQELAAELDEPRAGEAAGVSGEPQQPFRGDREDHGCRSITLSGSIGSRSGTGTTT